MLKIILDIPPSVNQKAADLQRQRKTGNLLLDMKQLRQKGNRGGFILQKMKK